MNVLKIAVAAISVLPLSFLTAYPGYAARVELPSWVDSRCRTSLYSNLNRLSTLKAFRATPHTRGRPRPHLSLRQANAFDTGYPPNAPYSVNYGLDGSGAGNILNSPKFLKSIANQVISQCSSVSKVVFFDNCGWYTECKRSQGFYLKDKQLLPIQWYVGPPDNTCSQYIRQWRYEGWCD